MSYVPIQVVENRQGITPGVYLATIQGLYNETSYVLEHGPDQDREVNHSNVMRLSPVVFVKAIEDKQKGEIKRLQQEVDDLRAPIKMPGDVYDALKKIQKSFSKESSYALITMYEYFGLESAEPNEVGPLIQEIKKVARWRDSNLNAFKLMTVNGFEREMTDKEKWIKNMMDLLNDPHIDQKGFLSGIYEQYQVADILKSLEGAGEGSPDGSKNGCPET